jgi:hypothetical protein
MNHRLIMIVIFVLLTIALVQLMFSVGKGSKPEPVTITELDAGGGRTIRITVETNSQGTLSLHYHVAQGEEVLIEHAFFGTLPRTSPPPGFVMYFADNNNLIGIAQAADPEQIVILHDFTDGQSFPMRAVTYKDTDTLKSFPYYEKEGPILLRGDALFTRLAKDNPDTPLRLMRTMGMRPLVLPKEEGL